MYWIVPTTILKSVGLEIGGPPDLVNEEVAHMGVNWFAIGHAEFYEEIINVLLLREEEAMGIWENFDPNEIGQGSQVLERKLVREEEMIEELKNVYL